MRIDDISDRLVGESLQGREEQRMPRLSLCIHQHQPIAADHDRNVAKAVASLEQVDVAGDGMDVERHIRRARLLGARHSGDDQTDDHTQCNQRHAHLYLFR